MKRFISALLIMVLIITLISCGSNGDKSNAQGDSQPQGNISASKRYFSFDDLHKKSDIIVEVEIIGYVKDVYDGDFPLSVYNARVLECYKNSSNQGNKELDLDKDREIRIVQHGNKESLVNDVPLYGEGEKLIAFLIEIGEKYGELEGAFIAVGAESGVFRTDKDDTRLMVRWSGDMEDLDEAVDVEGQEKMENKRGKKLYDTKIYDKAKLKKKIKEELTKLEDKK